MVTMIIDPPDALVGAVLGLVVYHLPAAFRWVRARLQPSADLIKGALLLDALTGLANELDDLRTNLDMARREDAAGTGKTGWAKAVDHDARRLAIRANAIRDALLGKDGA